VTLLAAFRTAYNLVGVLVLVPVIGWFTRFVEMRWGRCGSPIAARCWARSRPEELIADEAIARVDAVTWRRSLRRRSQKDVATWERIESLALRHVAFRRD
jgi:hypothetical protein